MICDVNGGKEEIDFGFSKGEDEDCCQLFRGPEGDDEEFSDRM